MNKMTKGAIATGIGVALLLGGGGTLALWSDSERSDAGTVTAGNLDLLSPVEGTWYSDLLGKNIDISSHRVVPGETLTYSQELTLALEGDKLEATVGITGDPKSNFIQKTVQVKGITLQSKDGKTLGPVLTKADDGRVIVASAEFKFLGTAEGRESADAVYKFGEVGFALTQKEPVAAS
jgi:alternate signal-mediated exported protein